MPTDRSGTWSDNLGTFSVEAFVPISATYGQRGAYSVGGVSGVSLTGQAVCTSVGGVAQVNDALRYSATFLIVS